MPGWLEEDFRDKRDALRRAVEEAGLDWPDHPELESDASRVLPCSEFVCRSCQRAPAMFVELFRSGDLTSAYDPGAFSERLGKSADGVETTADLSSALRRFRQREMVRIAWRDIAGRSSLEETVADLSALAEACLHHALGGLYRRQCEKMGAPESRGGIRQQLVVLAMGKLGAGELNFSSDIDLIFAYPETGSASGPTVTVGSDEWFTRLCRDLIRVIGEKTADGMVFRVDARLRPDGENGPLVMSFDNMESYYQVQGREWERYAWIKARPVAGDLDAGRELIRRLSPFVYRRYLDFSTFDALREMKRGISLEVKRRGIENDIKLGPGGIREIEFFGQIFQLIRGGVLPALRARPIGRVLSVLADESIIAKETAEDMIRAYRFFRMVEHRLQEFGDQQTHRLPADPRQRERLAFSAGFSSWKAFSDALSDHRGMVHRHFSALLEPESGNGRPGGGWAETALAAVWRGDDRAEEDERTLVRAGYGHPSQARRLLDDLKTDAATRRLSPRGRSRLDQLMPRLLEAAGKAADPETVLSRLIDLLRAVQRRTTYLALLLEHPSALAHLVRLAEASPWISGYLSRHPALLDELLDPRTLYRPPQRSELQAELSHRLDRSGSPELEHLLEELCLFKQVNVLRVAAADITGVLPLMRVSDHLSHIAEAVLGEVLETAWRHLVDRHGSPVCRLDGAELQRGFAVIAYGKLGGLELGYKSDLDLVFLHAGTGETTRGGKKPVDDTTFFARLGQRVLHFLTVHTAAGFLYEVDMRLRPSGTSGLLVSPVDAFGRYQQDEAWTWEHQALVRARPVGGDPKIAAAFVDIRRQVLGKERDPERLAREVADMRNRIRKDRKAREDGETFDLKQGPGGLVDIEFLVQYLVLCHAGRHPDLAAWTDNVRLIRTLYRVGVIDDASAALLRRAYLTYRSKAHRLNLQQQPARVPADQYRPLRREVKRVWRRFLPATTKM